MPGFSGQPPSVGQRPPTTVLVQFAASPGAAPPPFPVPPQMLRVPPPVMRPGMPISLPPRPGMPPPPGGPVPVVCSSKTWNATTTSAPKSTVIAMLSVWEILSRAWNYNVHAISGELLQNLS
ncbi:unnamed protein product [Musa hybrid cultivar]